ncbi:MAG: hypothetical protein JWP30_1062 [Homoserinimonas sp.]|jgi:Tfp pilus assembly protein PilN|nr:hypothetical protein [Homoserinimonas sp.]
MNIGRREPAIVIGGVPRIDFLPPEIKAKKEGRRTRRYLTAAVGCVAVLCLIAYVCATTLAADAQSDLADAQQRSQILLTQQGEFIEVRAIASEVATAGDALKVGSATEILWFPYLQQVHSTLPAGMAVTTFAVDSQSALEATPLPSTLLQGPRVATIGLTATSPGYAEIEVWLTNLRSLTGFADATVSSIALEEGTYVAMVTLNVNADAFERRFFEASAAPTDTEE